MKIDSNVLAEMTAHAQETYPDECCGLLVAGPDGLISVHRVRNIQNDMHAQDPKNYPRTAATAYAGHPNDLREGLELADVAGHELAAFYHSHPDHDAYFSEEDVRQATPFGEPSYPGAAQIVLSVYGGVLKTVKSFVWSDDAVTYVDGELITEGGDGVG
jgi:proteasome lid subunit RPN8/RPN11